jgi:hypothetical protein
VAESFFATVKVELAHDAARAARVHARGEVFEYLRCKSPASMMQSPPYGPGRPMGLSQSGQPPGSRCRTRW